MGTEMQAAPDRINQEIAKLTEARETLLRLFGAPSHPVATSATAKRVRARPPRTPKPAKAPSADAGSLTEAQAKVLRFLDKSGPSVVSDVAKGTGIRGPGASSSLRFLVASGLAEDNDGFFRLTDKGMDAALA